MHFVFEKLSPEASENFINCPDVNNSGIRRFTPSPVINAVIHNSTRNISYSSQVPDEKYIIASGVAHSPGGWCGPDSENNGFDKRDPNKQSVFAHLSEQYLKDLQTGKAWLLLDQSHEGHHVLWLWDWFHNNCNTYNINPSQIIYVTGNLNSSSDYADWLTSKNLSTGMLVIPATHFESFMCWMASIDKIVNDLSAKSHIEYKTNNLEKIKVYNALQKRPRVHRIWLFKSLVENNLLDSGINSMNSFSYLHSYFEGRHMNVNEYNTIANLLPMLSPTDNNLAKFSNTVSGHYITDFNEQHMLNSWVSVISEASFGDSERTCFISEKTFKTIACYHPFIIFGNKGSLAHLRKLGYKTFSPFIDETYDSLPTWERISAIIVEINKIKNMTSYEKLEWYKGMTEIVTHNYNVLKNNSASYANLHYTQLASHCNIS